MKKWTGRQAVGWKDFKPPSRPSKTEVKVFEEAVKKLKKDAKVLILGSTVELRGLCYKYGIKPYVVDYNKKVYLNITKTLMKRKGEDFFVEDNWIDMKFPFKFDLILGDLAFLMLPWKKQPKLAKKLHSLLKDNGLAVQRMWNRELKYKNMKKTLKEGEKLLKKGHYLQEVYHLPFLNYYYDMKKDCLNPQQIVKNMKRDMEKGILPKNRGQHFVRILSCYNNPCTMHEKADNEKMLKKHFKVVRVKYGKEIFKNMCPIYFLKKK
ncbi:hypothetical protein KY331_03140 [Candidatus Woesearchaeota archaeon]|nr:hypothetical protein [Candidatus Woesearchaeota archaeon]